MEVSGITCIVERDKYHYFEEYLKSLQLNVKFFPYDIRKGEKVLMVQKILPLNYENSSFIGLINTEQLSKKEWTNYFEENVFISRVNMSLFDYSKSNIRLMEEKYGMTPYHIPYKYNETENTLLKSFLKTEKLYDLAFIGEPIGRRKEIIKKLTDKGLKINIIEKWGEERDKEVGKCKALINIHFSEEFNIFEEIRCNRWLMAGMLVFSEGCLHEDNIEYKQNLHIIKREKYVESLSTYFRYNLNLQYEQCFSRIFIFWTERNPLTENRKKCIENIKNVSKVPVVFINPDNLQEWLVTNFPLHPAYQYLSAVHKADYLRCYFMHHHGGGYTDIKLQSESWISHFKMLNNSVCVCNGYQEIAGGVANIKDASLYKEMNDNYTKLIGNGSYIFKRNTFFTTEWYNELHKILDDKFEQLKENPASHFRDHKGLWLGNKHSCYPLEWTEILGNIFHPICYKYNCFILQTLHPPEFNSYQ